jgi:hypothetical protein
MNNLNQFSSQPLDLVQFYFYEIIGRITSFLPNLLIALILILLGYIVAWAFEFFVRWLILRLNINKLLSDLGFSKFLEKSNLELRTENFLGKIIFWIIFLLFLIPSFEIIGLVSFSNLLTEIVKFLPKILVGSFIFIASILLADFLKRTVYVFLRGIEAKGAELGSDIVYYGIFIFGLILALSHIGIAAEALNILLLGIVLAFALAVGLSFGLGGQELARHFLDEIRRKL